MFDEKESNEYAKLTIKFITRDIAEKVLNPIMKQLIEGHYDDIEYNLEIRLNE